MPKYIVRENADEIIFEGKSFKLSEIKTILKQSNAGLYKTISCPGEIRYTLSDEALNIFKQNPVKPDDSE